MTRRNRARGATAGRGSAGNRGSAGAVAGGAALFDPLFQNLITNNTMSEEDYRLAILNALLRTPHRNFAPYIPLFKHVHEVDPLFFGHLAAWYFENGSVHDLKQLFIACMATSNFSAEYREAAACLVDKLPPFQVERVVRMVRGYKDNGTFVAGVATSVPRSFRSAIEQYLYEREKNKKSFDSAVLHARKPLKTLYASLRIKPGPYAQQILFDDKPPEESRLAILKQIAKSTDSGEQARLIVENNIPYRIAVSCVKTVTPSILVALVNAMSPQEVINNMASLKKRGAMDNKDLRSLIDKKLEQAKTDSRVSALKTREAIKSAGLDEEMTKKVESVGDVQIKSKKRIARSTAILIDKSGSMEQAIAVGKQIASIVAPVCDAGLYVYAFDTMAFPIKAAGSELSDWEKAFKGITANGGTSCGVAVEMMRRQKQSVEQIVMVTDQEENTQPYLVNALKAYETDFGLIPSVMIVNVGGNSGYLQKALETANMQVDTFIFSGDYYSLPSILPLLSGGTRLDLLMEIMSYPIPAKKVAVS